MELRCSGPNILVCVLQEVWWALLLLPVAHPFYVPGVAPRNFHEGDVVDIKVILKSFCMRMRHLSLYMLLKQTLWFFRL